MRSILEEFAYGNISPKNQYFKRNSAYRQTMRAVSSNEEKLLHILDGEEKILFQKYVDVQGEVNQLTARKKSYLRLPAGLADDRWIFYDKRRFDRRWRIRTQKGKEGLQSDSPSFPFSDIKFHTKTTSL